MIDENTRNHAFGHYARVLVDVDLAGFLPDTLLVEREKFSFDIEIEYERPPYFCFTCNSIGRSSNHCKKHIVKKVDVEKVTTKIDPTKKFKQNFVAKMDSKPMTFEDPLINEIIRSRGETSSMFVGDLILENELLCSTSVETIHVHPVQVENDLTTYMTVKQREDQQSNKYPDLRIIGPWSDTLTNLDYNQDSPSWCGSLPSNVTISDEILNPNVAHDLEILQQHLWKGNDSRNTGPRVYTDEEEREATIRYLKNRSAATKDPFIEVVSRATKKKKQKGFQVHDTRSKGRLPD